MARMQVENRLLEADADQRGGELVATVSNANSALLVHAGAQFPLGVLAAAGRATVSAGEAGRVVVSIPLLEAGEYSVCDANVCKSTYVAPFGRAELEMTK